MITENLFASLKEAPPDPILGLTEIFNHLKHPQKVNLGVGIYQGENGKSKVFEAVRGAEKEIIEQNYSKDYLPISGDPEYIKLTEAWLYKEGDEGRFSCQTVGGTSGIATGARLFKLAGISEIYLPQPTWTNHHGIFAEAGYSVKEYPYYKDGGLDLHGLMTRLSDIPSGSLILFHACCHNPTGIDPTPEEWDEIYAVLERKGHIPFIDNAYQGLGHDEEETPYPVQLLQKSCRDGAVAVSFSKNFGLYGERTGLLTIFTKEKRVALSAIKPIIRTIYSNPQLHGARIVRTILSDPALKILWKEELKGMRTRLFDLRNALQSALSINIADQKGLFSYLPIKKEAILELREKSGIVMMESGRINVSGLNQSNLAYVIDNLKSCL